MRTPGWYNYDRLTIKSRIFLLVGLMGEMTLLFDLVLAIAAAFLGGALARRLGQPVILGYLLAGVAIGPYAPGLVGDVHNVQTMAELGVAFLMFALGVEFSITELLRMRWVASLGGIIQIAATIVLGVAVASMLGLGQLQGLFLGSVIALSSTMVAQKILMGRGELESLHGRIALGILIVQDLSIVLMMVILPAIAGSADTTALLLLVAAAKATAILAGSWILGTKVVPTILAWVAGTGSRELFLLAVITLALGTALGTYALGLSVAFGAFIAGLVISESDYSRQALAEVVPLRDIFASVFFVSVGMLIDPSFLLVNIREIMLVVVAIVAGKLVIGTAVPLIFRYPGREALLTGLVLAQIGEFSFVLTRMGEDVGVIGHHLASVILAAALVSILINPLLMHEGSHLHAILARMPLIGRLFWDRFEVPARVRGGALNDHVVICGYGRVGREMATILSERNQPFLVVELDPHVVKDLRRSNIPYIYGDAAALPVLDHAQVATARLVAATVPNIASVEMAVRNIRRLNPTVPIVARVHYANDRERVLFSGADDAVCPEFEAGLEFVRRAMVKFGVSEPDVDEIIRQRRVQRGCAC